MKHHNLSTLLAAADKPWAIVIGADCITGLQTARILNRRQVPVLGIATNPQHPCCRTRSCRTILSANTASAELIDVLRSIGPVLPEKAVLFPCTDISVLLISRHRKVLEQWFHFSLPDNDTVEMLIDKSRFYQFAQKEGFPIPPTYFLYCRKDAEKAASQMRFPAMIKPPVKTPAWEKHADKVYKVTNANELLEVYDRTARWVEVLMAQEWIDGGATTLFTSNCYFNAKSRPEVTFISRKLRQWPPDIGTGSLSDEFRNDAVLNETVRLFEHVRYRGLGYLEMKYDRLSDKHYIIEPNIGRPTGRSALAEAAGVELIYTMYCDCLGWPLPANRQQYFNGVKWIYWRKDLQAAWKYWRRGELTFSEWRRSLAGPKTCAVWSWYDPVPFLEDFRRKLLELIFKKKSNSAKMKSEMVTTGTKGLVDEPLNATYDASIGKIKE